MATSTKEEGHPHNLITSLPDEILTSIIEDDCLSSTDVAALRQTCRAFANSATAAAIVFHRIPISQLSHDRDGFLAICRSPHLAHYVRELDWQEVCWSPGDFDRIKEMALLPGCAGDDTDEICGNLETIAADLFWLPIVPSELSGPDREAAESQYQQTVGQFRVEFYSALGQLPNLHTFLSRPMPADRTLGWCEYPISAKLFQSHHLYNMRDCTPATYCNNGLFDFLLPAIEASAAPNITKLLWEDEPPGSSFLRQPCPAAFQRLETLSLSLIHYFSIHGPPVDGLAAALNVATNVQHLSLGLIFPESGLSPSEKKLQRTMLRISPVDNRTQWSRLSSLSLTAMPLVDEYLFSIMEANASTLRHLYLDGCNITLATIFSLGSIKGINLLSFGLFADENRYFVLQWLKEFDLLHMINNGAVFTEYPEGQPPPDHIIIGTIPMDQSVLKSSDTCSDAGSEDSLDYRLRTAPFWLWEAREGGNIFCYQSMAGYRTEYWKFTSRAGTVAFGSDPLDWFDDWDPEEGDIEEPTPYCDQIFNQIREFRQREEELVYWEHDLPPGAILYDEEEAVLVKRDFARGVDTNEI